MQMEFGHTGKLLVILVLKSLLEVATIAWKLENAEQLVVGTSTTGLWLAFVIKVRFSFNRVISDIVFKPWDL